MSPSTWRVLTGLALAGTLAWGSATPAGGQGCNTAPTANDDEADHTGHPVVVDVLANDTDADGEALNVGVTGWSCPGTVSQSLGLVTLTPIPPEPTNCTITYRASDERGASDTAVIELHELFLPEIFADGFESGDAAAWSSCEPACP
jgi:hypothetical protein